MALEKTIQTPHGLTVANAYHRVNKVSVMNKTIAWVDVGVFIDAENTAFQNGRYQFSYDIEGANPIKQAYEYLKTLPEFSGATDV